MTFLMWIDKQIEWVKGFFQEPDGKPSHKRLLGTLVVVTFLLAYLKNTVLTQKLEDIPVTWAMLIAGILGLAIAATHFANKSKNGNRTHEPGHGQPGSPQ